MIHFVVPRDQDFAIRGYLAGRGAALAPRVSVRHYEDLPAARTLPSGTYILSALDQLHPAGLRLAAEVSAKLLGAGRGVQVLNHPGETLLRFDLLEALHRQGLNRHRVWRADSDLRSVGFPVFLHEEHGHGGALSDLLRTPRQLAEALGLAIARGQRLRDLLVIEFCETADSAGYYRKYAAFVIGPRIFARAFAYGRHWMLKTQLSEYSEAMLAEELEFVRTNPHQAQLRPIVAAAKVGYGRIDYGIKDGRIETWEINLNPTIGPAPGRPLSMPPELNPFREPTRKLWGAQLVAALEALDPGGDGEPGIPIFPVGAPVAPGALLRRSAPPPPPGPLRRLLAPAKPLILRLVRAISPLLVRLTRRAD